MGSSWCLENDPSCVVLYSLQLLENVVLCDIVNKSYLDKYWQYQDIVYDYKAEIHGTGSQSSHYHLFYMVLIQNYSNPTVLLYFYYDLRYVTIKLICDKF